MRSLAELQSAMTQAVIAGSFVDVEGEFTAGNAEPARRYGIYRNNMFLSLTAHLSAVFPVTARLGDERFFAYAAHQFILQEPPRSSRLVAYGDVFAHFLRHFPACRHAPVLAEMAALEWAIHRALTSEQLPFIDLRHMSAASVLSLQPCLGFVVSRWPLLDLWAHQSERKQALPRKAARIAVVRHDDDIRFFELDRARFGFWRSLARGQSIEQAAARALARNPQLNLTEEILFLFRNRLVTKIVAHEPQKGQAL